MAYREELWKEAKKRCRLNENDIAVAKRLGLNPKSLIKNIPNEKEKWKVPVKQWIHDIDASGKKKSEAKAKRKAAAASMLQTEKEFDPTPNQSIE
jgi:hypothetical protein